MPFRAIILMAPDGLFQVNSRGLTRTRGSLIAEFAGFGPYDERFDRYTPHFQNCLKRHAKIPFANMKPRKRAR